MTDPSNVDAKEVGHELGENTRAFKTTGLNEVYFTVSESNWSAPRGTFMVLTGAYEHSNMLKDQIEQLTDAGFDVVTVDMPGEGQSYRHGRVGEENLLHMESYEERVEAAQTAMQYYQDHFADGGEAQFHVLTSGGGSVDFLNTVTELEAGSVHSVTLVNPHFDVDLKTLSLRDERRDPEFTTKVDPYCDTEARMKKYAGETVIEAFQEAAAPGEELPKMTMGYFNRYASQVRKTWAEAEPYQEAIDNNGIRISVVYDAESDSSPSTGDFIDENDIPRWITDRADMVSYAGKGSGLLYNPETIDNVIANAITNAEHADPRARIIGALQEIDEHEWRTELGVSGVQELQTILEDRGFSVGPTGVDGQARYASVAHTENAIADYFMAAFETAPGGIDPDSVDREDINPQNILGLIKATPNVHAPAAPAAPKAPSAPLIVPRQ